MVALTHELSGVDLKNKLVTSTEAELKSLQSSLRSTNEDTAAELVQTVFKKYVHLARCFLLILMTLQLCGVRCHFQRDIHA